MTVAQVQLERLRDLVGILAANDCITASSPDDRSMSPASIFWYSLQHLSGILSLFRVLVRRYEHGE